MASIGTENGRKRILFVASDGKRRTIRLGKITAKQALAFKVKLESLIAAGITGNMDDETSRWLTGLADDMYSRLAAVGLVPSRTRTATTLGAFLADYFASLNVKAGTAVAYGHTRRYLADFFGESRALRSITPSEADKWRQHLKASGLSEATTARRVGVARQIFGVAVRWKLIGENPFSGVKAGSQTNRERMFFITRDMAERVLAACPNTQWRLLFALSRFGGLRCPSEHLALTWADIDWAAGRVRVSSPKTAHHEGGECRFIPLFPELRGYLQDAFDEAEPGEKFIITMRRSTSANLRTHLTRIIHRAGLSPWPRLFHNLRASRQTELAERFPIHVVCDWIGNSRAIAQEHYLQTLDAHFAAACQPVSEGGKIGGELIVGLDGTRAAQNPAQQPAEIGGKGVQSDPCAHEKTPVLQGFSTHNRLVHNDLMGADGFEPS